MPKMPPVRAVRYLRSLVRIDMKAFYFSKLIGLRFDCSDRLQEFCGSHQVDGVYSVNRFWAFNGSKLL